MRDLKKKFFSVLVVLIMTACASTPPPAKPPVDDKPVVKPADTTTVAKPVETPVVTPVSDEEFLAARKAIAHAEEADAARYSPTLLSKAKQELAEAENLKASNPDRARVLLKESEADANAAYDEAFKGQKDQYLSRMNRTKELLLSIEADRFKAVPYAASQEKKAAAEASFETSDLAASRVLAEEAVKTMLDLYEDVNGRITNIKKLKDDTAAKMAEAESVEAFIWAPDTLESANKAYFLGADTFRAFQLDKAEEAYTQSRYLAQLAVQKAKDEKAKKETEDLMLETMRQIEKASGLTVVDENDKVIPPKPWTGEPLLKTAPAPEKKLQPSKPTSLLIPEDGSPAVLGEVDRLTYLDKAKELWGKGVAEKNSGNYLVANQFFLESQKYIRAYEALAVDKIYTVRLIPERRDSLWRIAEYANIYNNALAWPKIWKRNKKMIQNPDLIFPGWQLIIPPK